MISFLRGKPVALGSDYVIMDIMGVGYKVFMPSTSVGRLADVQEDVTIHTYMHVREDAMQLFGFPDEGDRRVFELLIQVSGIGPKVAMAILASIPGASLVQAIIQERFDLLTQIPGVGKKTAQRIVIELKDKMTKLDIGTPTTEIHSMPSPETSAVKEALQALASLGYHPAEAKKVVSRISAEESGLGTTDIIRLALKELGKF